MLFPGGVAVRHQEGPALKLGDDMEEEWQGQRARPPFSGEHSQGWGAEEPRAQPAPSPPAGTPGRALWLGALRLLLLKLLLFDLLLTCSRLRAPPAARGDPAAEARPLDPPLPAPAARPQPRRVGAPPPPPTAVAAGRGQGLRPSAPPSWPPRGSHPPSGSPPWREPRLGGGVLSAHPAPRAQDLPPRRILRPASSWA